MTCPGTVPTVLNGKTTGTVTDFRMEFECLTGFYMTGNKVITCSAAVWGEAPTCTAIQQHDEVTVFPDWLLYVLAAVLALLILLCLLCCICYFCCGRGRHTNVHPYGRDYHSDDCCGGCGGGGGCCGGGCCGRGKKENVVHHSHTDSEHHHHNHTHSREGDGYYVVRNGGSSGTSMDHNGVYLVPYSSRSTQNGHKVFQADTKDKSTSRNEHKKTSNSTTKTEDSRSENKAILFNDTYEPSKPESRPNITYVGKPAKPANGNVTFVGSRIKDEESDKVMGDTWAYMDSQAPLSHRDFVYGNRRSKTWKDSSNFETKNDGVYESGEKPKPLKPAKEVLAWKPHSQPIRNINTSTK